MKRKIKALKMFENGDVKSLSGLLPGGRSLGGRGGLGPGSASAQRRLVARAARGQGTRRDSEFRARGVCWGCAPRLSSRRDPSPGQKRKSQEAHWPEERGRLGNVPLPPAAAPTARCRSHRPRKNSCSTSSRASSRGTPETGTDSAPKRTKRSGSPVPGRWLATAHMGSLA